MLNWRSAPQCICSPRYQSRGKIASHLAIRRAELLRVCRPCTHVGAGIRSLAVQRYVPGMRPAEWFAERSARGMLTRPVGAWILIGLPVVATRI